MAQSPVIEVTPSGLQPRRAPANEPAVADLQRDIERTRERMATTVNALDHEVQSVVGRWRKPAMAIAATLAALGCIVTLAIVSQRWRRALPSGPALPRTDQEA